MSYPNSSRGLTPRLSEQADDIITEDTDWVTLATELDAGRYKRDD